MLSFTYSICSKRHFWPTSDEYFSPKRQLDVCIRVETHVTDHPEKDDFSGSTLPPLKRNDLMAGMAREDFIKCIKDSQEFRILENLVNGSDAIFEDAILQIVSMTARRLLFWRQ